MLDVSTRGYVHTDDEDDSYILILLRVCIFGTLVCTFGTKVGTLKQLAPRDAL